MRSCCGVWFWLVRWAGRIAGVLSLVGLVGGWGWVLVAQQMQPQVRDGAYDRDRTKQRRVIPYAYLREADVFWEKRIWRDIHVKVNEKTYASKVNLIFAYPKRPFSQILWEAVMSGEITAYDALSDEFTIPLTPSEVQDLYMKEDTQWVTDPITGEEVMEIVRDSFNPEYVSKYRIKEDWIFDKHHSMMYVRIIGICPYYYEVEKQEAFPMFWLYYPDLRHVLVNEEAFNVRNDAFRPSWDDIFERRFFESIIVKESNVYDRYIEEYLTGMDALYEGERIQRRILDFEEFLWSY